VTLRPSSPVRTGQPSDDRVVDLGAKVGGERAIDLEPIDGKPDEILERRPSGAEVGEPDPEAHCARRVHHGPSGLGTGRAGGLGQLEVNRGG
jgi:hypothetical protein